MYIGLFALGVFLTITGIYRVLTMAFVAYVDVLLLINNKKDSISYASNTLAFSLLITIGIVLMYLFGPMAQLSIL